MILLAADAPTAAQIWVPAVLSALATAIASFLVYRNAKSANAINGTAAFSQQQLAWTQQAMNEATSAKAEARSAVAAASEAERSAKAAGDAAEAATRKATAAESRLAEVDSLADKLLDWIARVVRKAHADGIRDGASPQVEELLRVINGGPPEVTSARIRRGEDNGRRE